MTKTLYIINPVGNGGAGPRVWEKFKKLWKEEIPEEDVIITKRPGHATEIAFQAKGYSTIVSVGGDGTVNEVMEGILKNKSHPSLALIPAGTGNDVGRNVGIKSVNDAAEALKENKTKKYDLLRIEYGQKTKYSFLAANFGFSGNHRIKPWMKRILGPTGAYYLGMVLEIILFRPWDMTLEWDTGRYSGKTIMVLSANVERSSGGSMVVGPKSKPTDGRITVTIIPSLLSKIGSEEITFHD